MNQNQAQKLLRKDGMGSIFAPNLLFDRPYAFVDIGWAREANREAAMALAPIFDYRPEAEDCDDYAFMWYGRMLEIAARNNTFSTGKMFGPAWGYWNGRHHMWGVVKDKSLYHFNYGQEQTGDFKPIRTIMA